MKQAANVLYHLYGGMGDDSKCEYNFMFSKKISGSVKLASKVKVNSAPFGPNNHFPQIVWTAAVSPVIHQRMTNELQKDQNNRENILFFSWCAS